MVEGVALELLCRLLCLPRVRIPLFPFLLIYRPDHNVSKKKNRYPYFIPRVKPLFDRYFLFLISVVYKIQIAKRAKKN